MLTVRWLSAMVSLMPPAQRAMYRGMWRPHLKCLESPELAPELIPSLDFCPALRRSIFTPIMLRRSGRAQRFSGWIVKKPRNPCLTDFYRMTSRLARCVASSVSRPGRSTLRFLQRGTVPDSSSVQPFLQAGMEMAIPVSRPP